MNEKDINKLIKKFSDNLEELFVVAGRGIMKFLEPPKKR